MLVAVVCIAAVLLDALLGEPRRAHPLVAFGALADRAEARWNRPGAGVGTGVLAAVVVILPPVLLAGLVHWWLPTPWDLLLDAVVLYLALGLRSLAQHAGAVAAPLAAGDLAAARTAVAGLVSRDTERLDTAGVAGATTESVLENGADAVFASLFWYAVAGLPGVVLHRLANTLDAMWGYRTPRYQDFGRFAARLDDALNWMPARLTAVTYALGGQAQNALRCWAAQGGTWGSPNAGPVMAAGAGALGITLGGPAPYHGGWRERPWLGSGPDAGPETVAAAITLVRRGVVAWLIIMALGGLAWSLTTAGG